MEKLLHYAWQNRLCGPLLRTSAGEEAEVIDPGLHNLDAGPDFFNAKIKIGGTLWAGNVEIHLRSSDWYRHHHEQDCAYNNVILHVVGEIDRRVFCEDGKELPQAVIVVPTKLWENYNELLKEATFPPCFRVIPSVSGVTRRGWLARLSTERLQAKTARVDKYLEKTHGDWERTFFITLSRNFGFGTNAEAFERWAFGIDLSAVGKHRDNLLQVEAYFLGQAGLLDEARRPKSEALSPKGRAKGQIGGTEEKLFGKEEQIGGAEEKLLGTKEQIGGAKEKLLGTEGQPGGAKNLTAGGEAEQGEAYFEKLQEEYKFLQRKFGLSPMNPVVWKFGRLRPQNFPYVRLAQLAHLFHLRRVDFSRLAEAPDAAAMRALFRVGVTPYWQTHYAFGEPGKASPKILQASTLNLILINTIAPLLFAYGRAQGDETLTERALELLQSLPAESNYITKCWERAGLKVSHAADSQALIHLRTAYCDRKDCLRCRFGAEYLRREPTSSPNN